MSRTHRVHFVTIVPSPYQRDLFTALAARSDIDLHVHYMEAASPDSPWPEAPLRPFERIMPGFWIPFRGARWHFNWRLPRCRDADFVVLSSFSSWTGQRVLRQRDSRARCLFWGERLRPQPAGWRELVQRKLTEPLSRVTALVGIGRAAEADYAARFPGPRHFCIPYHCDLSAFMALRRPMDPRRPFTFLFCGQMIRRKGVDLLVAAFDRLVASGLDVRLILTGREADLPEFLAGRSPAARSRIAYEGFQPPDHLPEIFSRADVLVLPSRHDGWGVVVNQALGAGLPVITSDAVGAGLDLVEDGVNGLRFPAGDVEALTRCMERVALSPDEGRQWGEASARKARGMTPERGAERWAAVFDTLAGSK